ncbi:MAG TPA: hypothetical protein IAA58_06165 [Candidatus Gallacutalibacter stercoravium]|nr:hypothetical protein [Candidatus Gallacutalibacter stercoravium]
MQVTTMRARVLRVRNNSMLVYDQNGRQTVVVNTTEALRYRPGERVCILYSGAMTRSIPPQITALCISRAGIC